MNALKSASKEERRIGRKPEVVVITGASAGVGRATVRRFAKDKASIALLARGVDGLEGTKKEVEDAGGRTLILPTDVADPKQVEAASEAVEREFGPIDIWINDAMTSVFAPLKDMTIVPLPAVNTTQFGWVRSRLPHKAKPLGKIFQPEVAAEGIHWAAHHRRRELYLGRPSIESIVGNKIAPGLLDSYLGCKGYKGQQTSEPNDPKQPDNLWEPVPGGHGAHGTFETVTHRHSTEFWFAKNRKRLRFIAAGCALAATALFLKHRMDT